MTLDFKEIPQGNIANGQQDTFELFARDFFEKLGFEILQHPSRGADGKKDLIVMEVIKSKTGIIKIKWLVSCKHKAHSGKSVSEDDEINILERIETEKCDGFLGFYSTLPSTSLENRRVGIGDKIKFEIFDHAKIESMIFGNSKMQHLFIRYFPNSFKNYKELNNQSALSDKETTSQVILSTDEIINATKTAIILVELEKLKEKYFDSNWDEGKEILNKFYKYSNHNNSRIARFMYAFLENVSHMARSNMPTNISNSIETLVGAYFYPQDIDNGSNDDIELRKVCIEIGYNLVYDASIHRRNYEIIQDGLLIIKLVFRYAKNYSISDLEAKVIEKYETIEGNLNRPDRNDLEHVKEIIKIYKRDLETHEVSYPYLPDHLDQIVRKNQEEIKKLNSI
jgi:hypothetical protein